MLKSYVHNEDIPLACTKLIMSHISVLDMVIPPLTWICWTKGYAMLSLKKNTFLWFCVYVDS